MPVGGGGLIAGVAAALKLIRPSVRVYGTGPRGACSLFRSFTEEEPVQLNDMPETIADGIRTPTCGYFTLPLVQRYVEDIVTVTDEEIIAALRLIWERCKLVVEPAAAAPLAELPGIYRYRGCGRGARGGRDIPGLDGLDCTLLLFSG